MKPGPRSTWPLEVGQEDFPSVTREQEQGGEDPVEADTPEVAVLTLPATPSPELASEPTEPALAEPSLRRSTRTRIRPTKLQDYV